MEKTGMYIELGPTQPFLITSEQTLNLLRTGKARISVNGDEVGLEISDEVTE